MALSKYDVQSEQSLALDGAMAKIASLDVVAPSTTTITPATDTGGDMGLLAGIGAGIAEGVFQGSLGGLSYNGPLGVFAYKGSSVAEIESKALDVQLAQTVDSGGDTAKLLGATAGAAGGFAVGGPPGAVVGGVIGWLLGDKLSERF